MLLMTEELSVLVKLTNHCTFFTYHIRTSSFVSMSEATSERSTEMVVSSFPVCSVVMGLSMVGRLFSTLNARVSLK